MLFSTSARLFSLPTSVCICRASLKSHGPVVLTVLPVKLSEVIQGVSSTSLVPDTAADVQSLLVIPQACGGRSHCIFPLSNSLQAVGHPFIQPKSPFDLQLLLVIADSIFVFVQNGESHTESLQDCGFLLFIAKFKRHVLRTFQVID